MERLSGESLVRALFLEHSLCCHPFSPAHSKTFYSTGGYLEAKKLSASQGSEGLRVVMRYADAAG